MRHPKLPEMKAEVVVVALLRFPVVIPDRTCQEMWKGAEIHGS